MDEKKLRSNFRRGALKELRLFCREDHRRLRSRRKNATVYRATLAYSSS